MFEMTDTNNVICPDKFLPMQQNLLQLVGPANSKKQYNCENKLVLSLLGDKLPQAHIVCSLDEKISDIIEKYKQTVNYSGKNNIILFDGNQVLNPDLIIANTKLYNNCSIRVIELDEQNRCNYINPMMPNQNEIINQQIRLLMNNNQIQTSPINPNIITIIFKLQAKEEFNNAFSVQCNLNGKVSDVIKSFRNKTNNFNYQPEIFIFNAKRIDETLTVAEAGLTNNSIISVLNDEKLIGGFFL